MLEFCKKIYWNSLSYGLASVLINMYAETKTDILLTICQHDLFKLLSFEVPFFH